MTISIRLSLLTLPLLFLPAMAGAQTQESAEKPVFAGDFLTVGAGIAIGPSYQGSDDIVPLAVGGIMGRVGPIMVNPRLGGLALDVIPDSGQKISFSLGPVARARFERTGRIKDVAVAALGERDTAIEVGGTAGMSINRLISPYDSLSFGVDLRWDVAKAHRGEVIAPSVTYLTPLSRSTAIILNVAAEHVDDNYAHYYYDVTPAGALASGLPVYDARGGWKHVGATLVGALDLDGNLLNGGFMLIGGISYARMLGDIRDSPIVSERGSANQLVGALGLAYTF